MKSPWLALLLVTIPGLVAPARGAAAVQPELRHAQGYVRLEGDQARLALAGNLFRIAVGEIKNRDGSRSTIYRDVDYPVRAVEGGEPPADNEAEPPPDDESDSDEDAEPRDDAPAAAPAKPPQKFAALIILGPEYPDPPPPGARPTPNRVSRPAPASVTYELNQYEETGGAQDMYLRLELDFSGTHPVVRSGYWSMENEAGEVVRDRAPDPGFDFLCEQGAYGAANGRIENHELRQTVPDELVVTLARVHTEENSELMLERQHDESLGTFRLKRKPGP